MEIRQLRTLLAVARTGSFTRAAEELHFAQSSVSEQIQALEAGLGVRLVQRTTRSVRLTPAGETVAGYAQTAIELLDRAAEEVGGIAGRTAETLTIGGLETLCTYRVPALLTRLREACPDARVIVREGNRGELYQAVHRGELDASVTFGAPPPLPGLTSQVIGSDRLMVVAPPGHPLGEHGEVEPADLGGLPFLATEPGCGFREMFDTVLGGTTPNGPRLQAEVASISALRSCVASSLGLALLPEMVVADARSLGQVVAVPLGGPLRTTDVTLCWLERRGQRPALRAFLEVAV